MEFDPVLKDKIEKITRQLLRIREGFNSDLIAHVKLGGNVNIKLTDPTKDNLTHVCFGLHQKHIVLGMADPERRTHLEEYLKDLSEDYYHLLQKNILQAIQEGTTLYGLDDDDLACGLGIPRRLPEGTPMFTYIVEIQYELGVSEMPFEKCARALAGAFLFAQIELNKIIN